MTSQKTASKETNERVEGKKRTRIINSTACIVQKSRLTDLKMQGTCLSQVGKLINYMYNINY